MTYQVIYSSESTMPMQSDELEDLLVHARHKNALRSISGALVYAEGMFLQILEGPFAEVQALMTDIFRDIRHSAVTILQEGDIPSARFVDWNMAYVSATPEQVARWAGISVAAGIGEVVSDDEGREVRRTAQFAQDILSLLAREQPVVPERRTAPRTG